jgi:hypothetical protein
LRRRAGLGGLAVLLLAASPAGAAPRPIYGGELALDSAPPPARDPSTPARDVPTWLVRLHALEPLYRSRPGGELEPVLANGPPRLEKGALVVPVRPGVVAHDGSPVDGAAVAGWLEALRGAPGRPELIRAFMSGPVTTTPDGTEVRVPWSGDLEAAKAALRDPALRWWASRPSGAVGSGPFRFTPRRDEDEPALVAFEAHRDGRPFLDAVTLSPDLAGVAARTAGHVQPDARGPFEATWYLAVGPGLARARPELAAALDGALDRRRLLGRFGAAPLRPAPARADREADGTIRAVPPLTERSLLALDALPADYVERLQLELTRLGVRVTVERVPGSVVDARRRDGAFDLLLDRVVEPGPLRVEPGPNASGASTGAPTTPQRRVLQLFGGTGSTQDLVDLGVVELARGRLSIAGPPLPSGAWLDLANAWVDATDAGEAPRSASPGEPAP